MCGIAGYLEFNSTAPGEIPDCVQAMLARMHHRGPDAGGLWAGEGIVLGHRRLAILDLDHRADQPMHSPEGRYTLVFNGEIYNFRELRAGLEAEGAAFRTTSDSEVLLALFAREGERMLPRLRGMFALAIWDAAERALFLARDPYGIKPLYYSQAEGGFLFASQVKALAASGLVSLEREPAALAGFYLWGSVPEPWTLHRGVFALPPGHWLRVGAETADAPRALGVPVCWHDLRRHWQGEAAACPAEEVAGRVRQAVTDSVRAHLVSDVPLSVFLSGGIDSGVIAGLASQLGAQVEGITLGFEEFAGRAEDETTDAAAIAAHYGLRHTVRRVSRAEFQQDLPRIREAMDQPSVDGINTWFASKAAAERGYKVVLSGVGGDELFFGYPSFRQIPRAAALGRVACAMPGFQALLETLPLPRLARRWAKPKLAGIPAFLGSLEGLYFLRRGLFLPEELSALMGEDLAREGLARLAGSPPGLAPTPQDLTASARVGLLESTQYLRNQLLRDSDWASMDHSLELRTPLVDAALLEALAPCLRGFVGGAGKGHLARSPLKPLPDPIITRPKTGFSIPVGQWASELAGPSTPADARLLAAPGAIWARDWARAVLDPLQA